MLTVIYNNLVSWRSDKFYFRVKNLHFDVNCEARRVLKVSCGIKMALSVGLCL